MNDIKKDKIEHIKEIDKAISILECCQYCWADQVIWGDEIISDYDAITQVIECLKGYKDSRETLLSTLK